MITRKTNRNRFGARYTRITALVILLGLLLPSTGSAAKKDHSNLRTRHYYYQAFNRRDPFKSLMTGSFEEGQTDLVNIYKVHLVGILSGGIDKFAMLEDSNGIGHILKVGDPIRNGNIISVSERSLIARVTLYGQTSSITLNLEGVKGKGE
ncbi:hypothetical protein J7M07_00315 [bacterium]|nr:hypothetical protein [bacterium]